MIPYVDTPTAWVGASEPFGAPQHRWHALNEFFEAAKKTGKRAVILPTSQALALEAREHGRSAIQIGSEPVFDVKGFDLSRYCRRIPVANRLQKQGARMEAHTFTSLSSDLRAEIDGMAREWLDSHRSVALGFLNRVRLWEEPNQKRYFLLYHRNRCVAFLGAVPIPARHSWYLVDLIRLPNAEAGATELLIGEAVQYLSQNGALEVTLGMSPLAPVDDLEYRVHPRIYGFLEKIFDRSDQFYGFRSLYQFKEKFAPTSWEPQFLILSHPLDWRSSLGLSRAICGQSLRATVASWIQKKFEETDLNQFFRRLLTPRVVPAAPPRSFGDLVSRLKTTLMMTGLALLLRIFPGFFPGSPTPDLTPNFSDPISAQWIRDFFELPPGTWAPLNLVAFLILASFLEVTVGSLAVVLAYASGSMMSATVIRTITMAVTGVPFLHEQYGWSLGILALVGAIAPLMRQRPTWIAFILGCLLAHAGVTHSIGHLDEFFAIAIGFILGTLYVQTT